MALLVGGDPALVPAGDSPIDPDERDEAQEETPTDAHDAEEVTDAFWSPERHEPGPDSRCGEDRQHPDGDAHDECHEGTDRKDHDVDHPCAFRRQRYQQQPADRGLHPLWCCGVVFGGLLHQCHRDKNVWPGNDVTPASFMRSASIAAPIPLAAVHATAGRPTLRRTCTTPISPTRMTSRPPSPSSRPSSRSRSGGASSTRRARSTAASTRSGITAPSASSSRTTSSG